MIQYFVECGKCNNCGENTTKICKNCRNVYYCNEECQEMDWFRGHKYYCKNFIRGKEKV
ncbi:MYND finger, partial [Meloidogyne graminicola]